MSIARVPRLSSTSSQERFELGISRSCCRNLFGPIDHAQLRAELEAELRRIAEEKKRRWNFDFIEVKPLDGDFIWQRVNSENRSVGFATNEELSTSASVRITPQHSNDDITHAETNITTRNTSRNTTSDAPKSCFETPERLSAKRLRKSPRITDYLRAKKGPSTSRRIKFCSEAGVIELRRPVQTRKRNSVSGSLLAKQSTLDQFMPKLRPRQSNGKVSS